MTGDRYAGEWPRERFRAHGLAYTPSIRTKSDIYRELVAPVNGGRVALLDLPVLRAQLVGLERRVARGGKDSIDHGPGGRDDVANAAAGALGLVAPSAGGVRLGPGMAETLGGVLDDLARPSAWHLGGDGSAEDYGSHDPFDDNYPPTPIIGYRGDEQ